MLRELNGLGRIHYTYQSEMRGLGDAIYHGKDFVGDDAVFAVLLADTVMAYRSPLPGMLEAWKTHGKPAVALEACPEERVSRYGVAGGKALSADVFDLSKLVEKPAPAVAPRLQDAHGRELPYHAFAARYLFTPAIFRQLESTKAGYGGEIQVTDAMEALRADAGFLGVRWPGKRLDIGNPAGLFEAARILGLADC